MLHDPAVALTDFALGVENGLLAWILARDWSAGGQRATAGWFAAFFGFSGMSALLGGVVHGFYPDESTLMFAILWRATLACIGGLAFSAIIAAATTRYPTIPKTVWAFSVIGGLTYCGVALFISQDYKVALAASIVCTLFLLLAFVRHFLMNRAPGTLLGVAGLIVATIAAVVQQSSAAVTSLDLDHNAIYHVLEAVALLLIFVAARRLVYSSASTKQATES